MAKVLGENALVCELLKRESRLRVEERHARGSRALLKKERTPGAVGGPWFSQCLLSSVVYWFVVGVVVLRSGLFSESLAEVGAGRPVAGFVRFPGTSRALVRWFACSFFEGWSPSCRP